MPNPAPTAPTAASRPISAFCFVLSPKDALPANGVQPNQPSEARAPPWVTPPTVVFPSPIRCERGRLALTPALSPRERENLRALFESSRASVASVALLPFRPEGALTPGRVGFHKRRERLPLSWGRGSG